MKKKEITVILYGKTEVYNSVAAIEKEYYPAVLACEGAERDRYATIIEKAYSGCTHIDTDLDVYR